MQDDKRKGTHSIENDPDRSGGKSAPGSPGERQPRRGEAAPGRGANEQPGGGRRSESEKPNSPDSRWGGGSGPPTKR